MTQNVELVSSLTVRSLATEVCRKLSQYNPKFKYSKKAKIGCIGRGGMSLAQALAYKLDTQILFFSSGNDFCKLPYGELRSMVCNFGKSGKAIILCDDVVETQATIESFLSKDSLKNLQSLRVKKLVVASLYKRDTVETRKIVSSKNLKKLLEPYGITLKLIYGERARHSRYLHFWWERI